MLLFFSFSFPSPLEIEWERCGGQHPSSFGLYSGKHQDLPKYYTNKAESFTVSNLHCNCVTEVMTQILYAGDGYKVWTVTLHLWCKDFVGNRINLASVRYQTQMDHIRWNELMDCWRSKIKDNIRNGWFSNFLRRGLQSQQACIIDLEVEFLVYCHSSNWSQSQLLPQHVTTTTSSGHHAQT